MVNCCYIFFGLGWLPILNSFVGLCTLVTSYTMSKIENSTIPIVPYISDTGALPPTSCVFTLMLNFTAYMFMAVGLVRFLQVRYHLGHDEFMTRIVNCGSFIVSIFVGFGLATVAAFQEVNELKIHLSGAYTAFFGGSCYVFLQVYLSILLIKEKLFDHRNLVILRFIIGVMCTAFTCCCVFFAHPAHAMLPPYKHLVHGEKPYKNGFDYYMSTCSEWLLCITFFLFVTTLAYEFSSINISPNISRANDEKFPYTPLDKQQGRVTSNPFHE